MRQTVYPSRNLLCREFLTLGFYLLIFCLIDLFSINLPNCSRSCAVSQMNRKEMKFPTCLNTRSNNSNFKNIIIKRIAKQLQQGRSILKENTFRNHRRCRMVCCCQVCCLPIFLYRLWHHASPYQLLNRQHLPLQRKGGYHGRYNLTSVSGS